MKAIIGRYALPAFLLLNSSLLVANYVFLALSRTALREKFSEEEFSGQIIFRYVPGPSLLEVIQLLSGLAGAFVSAFLFYKGRTAPSLRSNS